ncbi:MAG TPA: M23 family metallopeptidase [Brevibacterium sp.]|nr:M23 family metallopeptidase [Brevibacterium sp.]
MRASARIATALLTAAAVLIPPAATAEPSAQLFEASAPVTVPVGELSLSPVEVRVVPAKAAPAGLIADIAKERRWVSPVEESRFTSGYGVRVHPISGQVAEHRGIDLAALLGMPVRAPYRGTVVETGGCQSGCMHPVYGITGYYVVLEHPDGVVTTYNHLLSADEVAVGQRLDAGEVLGHIGMSGETTGPHLHLQVLVDGAFVDPETYLTERGVTLR